MCSSASRLLSELVTHGGAQGALLFCKMKQISFLSGIEIFNLFPRNFLLKQYRDKWLVVVDT